MAIDSENKRRCTLSVDSPGLILPVADNNMQAADRAHLAHIYRGLFTDSGGSGSGREGSHLLLGVGR